jgi:enoyl-CoA hydratase/carnithine racemase
MVRLNAIRADWIASNGKDKVPIGACPFTNCQTVTYTGDLGAWYAPAATGRATVAMVHSYGANRTDHSQVLQALQRMGYGIMAIDLGYEGNVAANNMGYGGGTREAKYVKAAVRYAKNRGSTNIVLLGYSAGGTEAILAASEGAGVSAVVADSSPVSFIHLASDRLGVPAWLFTPASSMYGWFSSGSLGGLTSVSTSYHIPTLIIQGSADHTVDPSNGPAIQTHAWDALERSWCGTHRDGPEMLHELCRPTQRVLQRRPLWEYVQSRPGLPTPRADHSGAARPAPCCPSGCSKAKPLAAHNACPLPLGPHSHGGGCLPGGHLVQAPLRKGETTRNILGDVGLSVRCPGEQGGSMDYKQILYAVEDGVAVVTLNRPEKLNAMTAQMGAEMDDAMAEADEDDDVRVVVVTGAGRGFCAGADLGSGGRFAAGWGEADAGLRRKLPMEVRKPVIAAINGPAVGAGLTWPLQADIRYVADDAKLAFAFVRRGVLPELASHVILARLCGVSKAAELLMSGRTFSGREAVEYGVATKAFPADQVLAESMALARDIATNAAPLSVAISKKLLWDGIGVDLNEVRRREGRLLTFTTGTADSREGTMAFLEKRTPRWQGRISKDLPDFL